MTEMLPVVQADRDAVQAFHRAQLNKLMKAVKDKTAGGLLGEDEGDAGNLVQAFARHRHQARAEVVREIVAWLRENNIDWCNCDREIEAKFGTHNVAD